MFPAHFIVNLLDAYHRFIAAENTTVDQGFFDALAADKDLGSTRGIDAALKEFKLDALLLPTDIASTPPAIVGYPIVTGMCQRLHLCPLDIHNIHVW